MKLKLNGRLNTVSPPKKQAKPSPNIVKLLQDFVDNIRGKPPHSLYTHTVHIHIPLKSDFHERQKVHDFCHHNSKYNILLTLSKNLFKADGVFESISVHFQINLAEKDQVNELIKPEANQALDVPKLVGK